MLMTAYGCLIYKGIGFVYLAVHAHLFHQATLGGFVGGLAVAGMAATGVGPQARGVVFRQSALLHEEFALGIEDEDGESTMQMRADMGGLLLHQTYLVIVIVY